MELTPWTIYLIDACDSLKGLFFVAGCVISAVTLGASTIFIDTDKESRERVLKNIKRSACAITLCALGATFTPSSKTLVAMYVLPAIVNNERVQGISVDLMKLAEKWVKEQLGEKENHEPQRSR